MKKLLLTVGLIAAGSLAYGQGTVYFSNSGFYRLSIGTTGVGTAAAPYTTANTFRYGLFYGLGSSTSFQMVPTLGVNSTTGAGLIASSADNKTGITALQIPNSTAGEADVWIYVAGWSGSFGADWQAAQAAALTPNSGAYFGQSIIVNCAALGPSTGPGAGIWQALAGTNAKQIKPFVMYTTVPEPSSMALVGLGAAALMIFRRRK